MVHLQHGNLTRGLRDLHRSQGCLTFKIWGPSTQGCGREEKSQTGRNYETWFGLLDVCVLSLNWIHNWNCALRYISVNVLSGMIWAPLLQLSAWAGLSVCFYNRLNEWNYINIFQQCYHLSEMDAGTYASYIFWREPWSYIWWWVHSCIMQTGRNSVVVQIYHR